jgi:hypothetical protein
MTALTRNAMDAAEVVYVSSVPTGANLTPERTREVIATVLRARTQLWCAEQVAFGYGAASDDYRSDDEVGQWDGAAHRMRWALALAVAAGYPQVVAA